ncbi:MAG TPA: zinc ribbon domain-containing protein [Candidatus Acidoferrales bacterium]|nr:zinc ribbon domain-containing protein [Candidatus Acidoferrales bacterium]
MQTKTVCTGCGNELSSSSKFCTQCGKEVTVSGDLITLDNVSKELLISIFEAAYMDVKLDNKGDIVVKEQLHCYVFLMEKQRIIRLLIVIRVKPGISAS